MDQFELTVTDIHAETELIRTIKLARPHGEPLPSWEAGAHVNVRLPDGAERSYSLINTSLDPAATTRSSIHAPATARWNATPVVAAGPRT